MKSKLLLIVTLLFSINASYAQIKLKDDSLHPAQKDQHISADSYKNLLGYSRYTATILGYADYCQFSKTDQKTLYDHFFNKIGLLKLTSFQEKELTGQFFQTAQTAKALGVNNSKLTCEKFRLDFNKIMNSIQEGK